MEKLRFIHDVIRGSSLRERPADDASEGAR
jgi:hypothetical protein